MKVVIFAGGWGTRLGQIAERTPKPMVPIGERPILWHIMDVYARQGFREFVICLGVKGDVVRDYFEHLPTYSRDFTIDLATGRKAFHASAPAPEWKVTLADTGLNALKGARLKRVERYLDGENHFLTYGDGLAAVDLAALLDYHRRHGKLLTVTGIHPPSRFGEIEERQGRVVSFQEKPQSCRYLVNGGYMVFNRRLLDHLTADDDCDLEPTVIKDLARRGEVMLFRHDGPWACLDHERDVHHLNALLVNGDAFWRQDVQTPVRPALTEAQPVGVDS